MPTMTQFTDRKTGEIVSLRDLDETMCEHQRILPDDRHMCGLYDFVCLAGIAILAKSGKSEVDEVSLERYVAVRSDLNDTDKSMLRYYLVENYIFTAWYSRR